MNATCADRGDARYLRRNERRKALAADRLEAGKEAGLVPLLAWMSNQLERAAFHAPEPWEVM